VNPRCAVGRATPGELLRLVTDGMTGVGFDASQPEPGENHG
jgi:hypothetical protein